MSGLSQDTPPKADVSQQPQEHDPLEGLLCDPVSDTGLGRRLESGVPVPKVPVVGVNATGTIPKQRKEKKKESVGVVTETTTAKGRGRRSRVLQCCQMRRYIATWAIFTSTRRYFISDWRLVANWAIFRLPFLKFQFNKRNL